MDKNLYANRQLLLAKGNLSRTIMKFAIPAIVSNLVSALYNIVDQIFIGQSIGLLGNAATNVAFPLVTVSTAAALLIGIGTASNFNLRMGEGNKEKAANIVGNGISYLLIFGVSLAIIVALSLTLLIKFFGATQEVFPYAREYTGITNIGIPLMIFSLASSHIIRADGSPSYAMFCMVLGAVINTILDPIFLFGFNMGISGAAIATVIGQGCSAIAALIYLLRFKSVKLKPIHFIPRLKLLRNISGLGAASCFNQLAITIVQIVLNNVLTHYGEMSIYGSNIPLACVGVITKINFVYMAFTLGISQGCQPVIGYNYGAGNLHRVKQTYLRAAIAVSIVSLIAEILFQSIPRQIVSIFGAGSEEYFRFAARYLRIFMAATIINGLHPLTANFFTSIGKAKMGIFLSMTRQIIFLLPLIVIFPIYLGIDGVMYAGPIADCMCVILGVVFMVREFKLMDKKTFPPPEYQPDQKESPNYNNINDL